MANQAKGSQDNVRHQPNPDEGQHKAQGTAPGEMNQNNPDHHPHCTCTHCQPGFRVYEMLDSRSWTAVSRWGLTLGLKELRELQEVFNKK
jgi:hypothetical protein